MLGGVGDTVLGELGPGQLGPGETGATWVISGDMDDMGRVQRVPVTRIELGLFVVLEPVGLKQ